MSKQNDVLIVKRLNSTQQLVTCNGAYFVVSQAVAAGVEDETIAFRSDDQGKVTSYHSVAGGRNTTPSEVIEELRRYGPRSRENNWLM